MKNQLLIFTILSMVSFTSCKKETKKAATEGPAIEEGDIIQTGKNSPATVCYGFTSKKDTVLLQMEMIKEKVIGTLSYNYFEKDKNNGTFKGTLKQDTLRADYTFNAEGTQSVREILFVRKGNKLMEGFAEVEEMNRKMQFKKDAKFSINENMPLTETECGEN